MSRVVQNLPEPDEIGSWPETLATRFAATANRDEKARLLDLAHVHCAVVRKDRMIQ